MLRAIILIIVLLLVLSFFGVSVQHIIESPTGQSNFSYVGDLLQQGWNALVIFFNSLFASIENLV
jgi:hypothetical protein